MFCVHKASSVRRNEIKQAGNKKRGRKKGTAGNEGERNHSRKGKARRKEGRKEGRKKHWLKASRNARMHGD
jgi:hypothetical protein